jgi:hypothetical protein
MGTIKSGRLYKLCNRWVNADPISLCHIQATCTSLRRHLHITRACNSYLYAVATAHEAAEIRFENRFHRRLFSTSTVDNDCSGEAQTPRRLSSNYREASFSVAPGTSAFKCMDVGHRFQFVDANGDSVDIKLLRQGRRSPR